MGCYCGCETKENKIKWIASIATAAIGLLFFILHFVIVVNAHNSRENCRKSFTDSNCDEKYEDQIVTAGVLQIIAIVLWIISTVPLYMMCCCTNPPEKDSTYVAQPAAVQMADYSTQKV